MLRAAVFLAVFLELIYFTSVPAVQRVLFGDAQVRFYEKNHNLLLQKLEALYDYVMNHYSSYVCYALWAVAGMLGICVFYACWGRRSACLRGVTRCVKGVGRFFGWLWVHL